MSQICFSWEMMADSSALAPAAGVAEDVAGVALVFAGAVGVFVFVGGVVLEAQAAAASRSAAGRIIRFINWNSS
jgi:hypothetical protein